jgi:hypothetical protein
MIKRLNEPHTANWLNKIVSPFKPSQANSNKIQGYYQLMRRPGLVIRLELIVECLYHYNAVADIHTMPGGPHAKKNDSIFNVHFMYFFKFLRDLATGENPARPECQ